MTDERITHRLDQIDSDVERMAYHQVVAAAKLEEAEKFIGVDPGKLAARIDKAADAVGKIGNQLVSISEHNAKLRELTGEAVPDDPVPTPDPEPEPGPDNPPDEDEDDGSIPDEPDDGMQTVVDPKVPLVDIPTEITVKPTHPRLLLNGTQSQREEIKAKLNDPAYRKEANFARSTPWGKALLWDVEIDVAALAEAKQYLLELPTQFENYDGVTLSLCCIYDWIADTLTAEEKLSAFQRICASVGFKLPAEGSTKIEFFENYRTKDQNWNDYGFVTSNDWHEPNSHIPGGIWRGLIALAFYGDGVRDEWCQYGVDMLYKAGVSPFHKIYHPTNGCLVDGHNLLAGWDGGSKAGKQENGLITNYTSFFTNTWWLLQCWRTATGDDVVNEDRFFRGMGRYLVEGHIPAWHNIEEHGAGGAKSVDGKQLLYQIAGYYKDIDPINSQLCMYATGGDAGNLRMAIPTLILADKSIEAKSPEELGLPLAKKIDGGSFMVSRSGWNYEEDVRVTLSDRDGDMFRQVDHAGILEIHRGIDELVCSPQDAKGRKRGEYSDCVWIFDPETGSSVCGQDKGVYWGCYSELLSWPSNNTREYVPRTNNSNKMATLKKYKGSPGEIVHDNDAWSKMVVDSAPLRWVYDKDGNKVKAPVSLCQRTVVHVRKRDAIDYVIVKDEIECDPSLKVLWSCRVMDENVSVSGNVANWEVGGSEVWMYDLGLTQMSVKGADDFLTEGPYGEDFDKLGYYWRRNVDELRENEASHSRAFGKRSIYGYPNEQKSNYEFLRLFAVGPRDATLPSVSRDSEFVTVGDLVVNTDTLEVKG